MSIRSNLEISLSLSQKAVGAFLKDTDKLFKDDMMKSFLDAEKIKYKESIKFQERLANELIKRQDRYGDNLSRQARTTNAKITDDMADGMKKGLDRSLNTWNNFFKKIEKGYDKVISFMQSQAAVWLTRYFSYQAIKSSVKAFADLEEITLDISRTLGQWDKGGALFGELIGGAQSLGMEFRQ